jgi:hypothetical protein
LGCNNGEVAWELDIDSTLSIKKRMNVNPNGQGLIVTPQKFQKNPRPLGAQNALEYLGNVVSTLKESQL